jgi:hypothetical protein
VIPVRLKVFVVAGLWPAKLEQNLTGLLLHVQVRADAGMQHIVQALLTSSRLLNAAQRHFCDWLVDASGSGSSI